MAASFQLFGPAHLGAIALTFATPSVLCAIVRLGGDRVATRIVELSLAALLVGNRIVRLFLLRREGELTIETAAPMHLCDWAAIMAVVTLICPNQRTYELCYFWALAGTLQALLTPDLSRGFPDAQFISFFVSHGGVIAAALFLTLCGGMRPVPRSIPRTLMWSLVYLAAAMATNALLGTNFGYLRMKPANPSLLDHMAPWPFYIAQLAALAVALVMILYAPFFILDRLRRGARGG